MEFTYTPHGVCSRQILLELDGNKVSNVRFIGGCSGNTQGVARLAEGMDVDELISRLQGIRCGSKPTSCPDQLAKALLAAKEQQNGYQKIPAAAWPNRPCRCCSDWANMRIFACAAAGLASCFALNHRSPRYTAPRK